MSSIKVDKVAEKEVQDWIERVLGDKFTQPFQNTLSSGAVLCRLANAIKPDSIPDIYEGGLESDKIRINVLNFLRFCKNVCRVSDYDLFQPENVIVGSDMTSVVQCLQTLGRCAPRAVRTYAGPMMFPDTTPIFRATQAEKAKQVNTRIYLNTYSSIYYIYEYQCVQRELIAHIYI